MFLCLTALKKEWGDLSVLILTEMKIIHSQYELWHSDHMPDSSSGFLFLVYVKSMKDYESSVHYVIIYEL